MAPLYKRVLPVEATYQRLRALMPQVGVAHVVELTLLDSLGLPVCMAFGSLPPGSDIAALAARAITAGRTDASDSDGKLQRLLETLETFQMVTSNNGAPPLMTAGKGLSPLEARVSAMMEAVERASARQVSTPTRWASLRQLMNEHRSQTAAQPVDPRQLLLISPDAYDEDQPLEWVAGYEMKSGASAWVPVEAATFTGTVRPDGRLLVDTPTGLGAGNSLAEAVCHGLAEAIEHDAWALAVARQALNGAGRGLFGELAERFEGASPARSGPDNQQSGAEAGAPFRLLDFQALKQLPELNDRLGDAWHNGDRLRCYDITADVGVPVISVSVAGMSSSGPDGGGLGAHPEARVALARALTEAAQQRMVLGLQQNLRQASEQVPRGPVQHAAPQAQFKGAAHWATQTWEQRAPALRLEELPSMVSSAGSAEAGIQADIQYMLSALQWRGFERVVVVDLQKPGLETPVVKVIVPGLADYWNSAAPPNWQAIQRRLQFMAE